SPAIANLRARPRPWSPVPPSTPMVRPDRSGAASAEFWVAGMTPIFPEPARGPRSAITWSTVSSQIVTNPLRPDGRWGTMVDMNADQVAALRALLAPTGWLER